MIEPTPLEVLGRTLRVAREERDITKAELARRLHIHPSHWGRIETGDAAPSIGLLLNAAAELGLPMSLLQPVLDRHRADQADEEG